MASARDAFQRQRAENIGASSRAMRQHMLHGLRLEEFEYQFQRESMLFGERDVDAVVGSGRLQFEIEGAAEALAQSESPGPIDARSEGCMDHKLHSAGLVEESLRDYGLLGWQSVERSHSGLHISDGLLRAGFVQAALFDEK